MRLYLDSAVVVSAMTNEEASPRVQAWLESNASEGYISSRWLLTEFASALAQKERRGDLRHDQVNTTAARFQATLLTLIHFVDFAEGDFARAAQLVRDLHTPLRASDALHLAIALRVGAMMVTLDQGLARAAAEAGVSVADI